MAGAGPARANGDDDHDQEFINPYAFVPFAPVPGGRAEPAGHDRLGTGRLSGRIAVTASARTAIMIRGTEENGEPLLPWRPGPDGARNAIIPGSSFAGAVRSLHETIVGGCLRVFDREFLPTYRDVAVPGSFDDLLMCLVTESDGDGTPTSMIRCDDVVWVDAVALGRIVGPLRSGMALRLADPPFTQRITEWGRDRVEIAEAWDAGEPVPGTWLVLIGDAGARLGVETYRIALGRISDGPEPVTVDGAAWTEYERCALDAADMRVERTDRASLDRLRAREAARPPDDAAVSWNGMLVGHRQLVRPWLRPGTVLWIREQGGRIVDLRPAVLWRFSGAHPAEERVPPELIACRDPADLCPTCRTFGSADVERAEDVEDTEDREQARQRSYAGHVRFTDLTTRRTAPDEGPVRELAPLSTPRPGSGQFYLDNRGEVLPPPGSETTLRQWGSHADAREPRRLRGRKYYWITKPGSPRRADRRAHHSADTTTRARIFAPEKRFTTTVWFDGLSVAELGGLLAALQPALLLAPASSHSANRAVCLPIGGGKPFGFGALSPTVALERVDSAGSRYGDEQPPAVTVATAVAAFRESVPEGIRDTVWPALGAVLTPDHVNPERVWYPPGEPWSRRRAQPEQFDRGFEFWKATQGQRMKRGDRPLTPLPDPAAGPEAQYLPIVRKAQW